MERHGADHLEAGPGGVQVDHHVGARQRLVGHEAGDAGGDGARAAGEACRFMYAVVRRIAAGGAGTPARSAPGSRSAARPPVRPGRARHQVLQPTRPFVLVAVSAADGHDRLARLLGAAGDVEGHAHPVHE